MESLLPGLVFAAFSDSLRAVPHAYNGGHAGQGRLGDPELAGRSRRRRGHWRDAGQPAGSAGSAAARAPMPCRRAACAARKRSRACPLPATPSAAPWRRRPPPPVLPNSKRRWKPLTAAALEAHRHQHRLRRRHGRTAGSCSSAKRRAATKTASASPLSAAPGNCWTRCWPASGWTANATPISPM